MLCIINIASTVITTLLAMGTLTVLGIEDESCSTTYLRLTLWLMLGMHATNILESVCQITGLAIIFCGCICNITFFLYEVGVLIYMQIIFYHSDTCRTETPKQYWWLLTNLIIYFSSSSYISSFSSSNYSSKPSLADAKEALEHEN